TRDVAERDARPRVVGDGPDELEHAVRALHAETGEAGGPQAAHLAGRRGTGVRHRGRRRRGCALLPWCAPGCSWRDPAATPAAARAASSSSPDVSVRSARSASTLAVWSRIGFSRSRSATASGVAKNTDE